MSYASLIMQHPTTKSIRKAPIGFSWTILFFNLWVPLLRKHWVGALMFLIIYICTLGLATFVYPFIYNKMYLKSLIKKGYQAVENAEFLDGISQNIGLRIPRVKTLN